MPEDNNDQKNQETTPKTETSRLKISKAAKSSGQASQKDQSGAEKAAPEHTQSVGEDTEITDPMTLRDTNTSKVRRIVGSKGGPEATAVVPGSAEKDEKEDKTDTVQLKVVQQKKKEIADMMSPSSTVRLRAPGGGRATASRPGSRKAKDTLKISPAEAPKATSGKEQKPEGTQQVSKPEEEGKTSTQPLKKMTTGNKPAAPSKTGGETEQSGKTLKRKASQKGGRTLKLKTGANAAQRTVKVSGKTSETDSGKTVQVSPEQGDKTVKVSTEEADKTVKAEGKAGLKLKQRPSTAAEGAAAPVQASPEIDNSGQPGIGVTLAAVASFAATGVLLYFVINQVLMHIW